MTQTSDEKLWKLFIFLSEHTNIFVDEILEILLLDLIVEVIVLVVGDWLLEADEDAACDADDEDETQDDEGGHDDQDHQAIILLRRAEESQSHIHGSLKY